MKTKFIITFLLVTLSFSLAQSAEPNTPMYARVDAILRNWKSGPPESLRDPSNSDLLAELRRKAQEPSERRVRVILLELQDPEIVQLCLGEFHEESTRTDAAGTFALCNEAELILLFIGDLNREEGTKSSNLPAGEEVARITPVSVQATKVIQGIIAHSPQFNQSVKAWAAALPTLGQRVDDRDSARNAVRAWWNQNESLLRAKQYAQVQPPN
jgi:hypothetical protein